MYTVYSVNINDKPVYVGSTSKTLHIRWTPSALHKRFGECAVAVPITVCKSELTAKCAEAFFIHKFDTYHKGENQTLNGQGVHLGHTAKTRAKISDSRKGKTSWNKGKTHSDETRAKISKAATGRKFSSKTRAKLSAIHKGRKFSHDHRAKISEANTGNKRPDLAEYNRKNKRHPCWEFADEIRTKYATGNYTKRQLADEYGCKSTDPISKILDS